MDYSIYMEDDIEEALKEKNKFMGITESTNDIYELLWKDDEEVFTEDKEGVYKENYYFRDHIQIPYVSKELAKPRVQEALIEFIGKFLDTHATQLRTVGPIYTFTFSDKETKVLYDLFNINADMLIAYYDAMVKETYYGKISKFITGWINNSPHKILVTAMIIESLQKGYTDIIQCCEYMLAFTEYPILYSKYWALGVKEDVMIYTIEHLSSKYKAAQVKNLRELLLYDAHKSIETHSERLKTGADNEYIDFLRRLRNQIKNKIENIARAYYYNNEHNNSQHTNVTTFDDGTLADQEGINTNISQIINNTITKFASGTLNNTLVKVAAEGSQVDKGNLTGFLNQIMSNKNNRLNKLVEDIITIYFQKYPTSTELGSGFVNFGISLYRSIGTSKVEMYQEIKSILNFWIYDIVNIKQYYNREGTWINYTRAVFNYIILMINYYN